MSVLRTVRIGIFSVSFLFISSGCGLYYFYYHVPEECRPWVTTFFRMSDKEQVAQFGNYDIETRYQIYICSMQTMHPPLLNLVEPFAMGGKDGVDFLKVKLLQAKDDETISDIISVFSRMSLLKTYDVMGDSELMKLLTDSIARIKDDFWRQITKRDMREMRTSKWFAMDEKNAVVLLKAKLLQTQDDETISDIIFIFSRIKDRKTYDVTGDSELMKLITDSFAKIKNDFWRQMSEEEIRYIKTGYYYIREQ